MAYTTVHRIARWLARIAGIFLVSTTAGAYELLTHQLIAAEAVASSELASVLQDLGINASMDLFPNSQGQRLSVKGLIQIGARMEDHGGIRVLNHFFNPLTNLPLTESVLGMLGSASPDWALEDNGDVIWRPSLALAILLPFPLDQVRIDQVNSYRHARENFRQALTATAKSDRITQTGLLFQNLGQVIHHLADMAQPEHVRNDAHLDVSAFPNPLVQALPQALQDPSLYEAYTEHKAATSTVQFRGMLQGYKPVYPPQPGDTPQFSRPRDFWATAAGQGIGIAEFTNRNFVSNDTNFIQFNSNTQALPCSELSEIHSNQNFNKPAASGLTIQQHSPFPTSVDFVQTRIDDRLRATNETNAQASAVSIFAPILSGSLFPCVFSINSLTMDAAHQQLLKRAVGYSAGLINYFFRGKINLAPSQDFGLGWFDIINQGAEALEGTFTLYYDVEGSEDRQVLATAGPNLRLDPAGQMNSGYPIQVSIPRNFANPGKAILVFEGKIGSSVQEQVVGKVVNVPEPATVLLLAAGLALIGISRRHVHSIIDHLR
jgi:hypothetical protein